LALNLTLKKRLVLANSVLVRCRMFSKNFDREFLVQEVSNRNFVVQWLLELVDEENEIDLDDDDDEQLLLNESA